MLGVNVKVVPESDPNGLPFWIAVQEKLNELPALGPVTALVKEIGIPCKGKAGTPLMPTWSMFNVRLVVLKTGSRNRPLARLGPL
jgi:hypothetical protein